MEYTIIKTDLLLNLSFPFFVVSMVTVTYSVLNFVCTYFGISPHVTSRTYETHGILTEYLLIVILIKHGSMSKVFTGDEILLEINNSF